MIQFDKKILPYISGEKFSNALTVEIKELFSDNKRVDLIKNLCVNKKIIHIGCVDHLPLIEEKIKENHNEEKKKFFIHTKLKSFF